MFYVSILFVSGHKLFSVLVLCPDSPCIGTGTLLGTWFLSRFSLYRDSNSSRYSFYVSILLVSGHKLFSVLVLCPDSPCIGTETLLCTRFMSRFSLYRDRRSSRYSFSVSILLVSGQELFSVLVFCLDSPCIETETLLTTRFLSRFSLYRDRNSSRYSFSVSILLVSGQKIFSVHVLCLDSPCIGTVTLLPTRFLSRFSLYPDINPSRYSFYVQILLVSRHKLFYQHVFCPDSPCIET